MHAPSRQAAVLLAVSLFVAAGTLIVLRSKPSGATIAFWFDPISNDTLETLPEEFGGPLAMSELRTIESIAAAEIVHAFREFQVTLTSPSTATYRIRVVDSLRLPIAPRVPGPSAESRSIPGLAGQGAVNFRLIAHSAIAFAPAGSDRGAMVGAIGRGIGRAAVHEFAHQILGSAPIHNTKDIRSYEYDSAARVEQYYGDMHWDIARPLLAHRIGLK